jgi:hypothetical protein
MVIMKTLNEMKKITLYFLLFLAVQTVSMAQIRTVGTTGGDFTTLKAAFDSINSGYLKGNLTFYIIDNTAEVATAVLYESGHNGLSSYSSVTIYPTVPGLTVSGNIDGPLIDLNGADNITFDGRVYQTGLKNLTIINTSIGSSTSTVRFIQSARNNTIKYCKILGSEGSSTSGLVFFSTDGTGGGGNSSNNINNNDITSNVASGRPINAIYSSGTVSPDANSGNIVANNNIFDFLNTGANSAGVYLSSNSTGWTISGNSFYETTSFSPTADGPFNIILIDNTSGNNFTVTGNFIGGQAPSCGGSSWTKNGTFNNVFTGIYLNVGTGTSSNIQNNTIKNFGWSNSGAAGWTGINIAEGDVNIGTVSGNIVGANGGSIIVSGGLTNTNVYGINIAGTGVINCQYNNIGYFIIGNNGGTNATNFYGIGTTVTGTTSISNNLISQIVATSPSLGPNSQYIYGIYNSGSGNVAIASNTINNMINYTSNSDVSQTGLINGIASSAGINTISNNIVNNLTIGNANNSSSETASVCGIALTGSSDPKTVTGNKIYTLNNYNASFSGSIVGLYFSGNGGANMVSGNFIYSLLPTGASSTAASVYGIEMNGGACTFANNIITLGGTTSTTIYGIYESGSPTTNLYFNTVYISGNLGSGVTNFSYALYNGSSSAQSDFRNNIFVNARSTSGGSALHYAAYITTGGSITCDYNDYFVSGTGGILGFYGGNINGLPIVTGQDANSLNIDPAFASPSPTSAADFKVSALLPGFFGTGITVDYGLNPRGSTVTMGAWENANNLNKWRGTTSNDWSTTSNWTAGVLPSTDASIIFDTAPTYDCYLDADHSVTDITNGSTKKLVTNGHKLTIKGVFNLATSAQIDALSTSSTVEFAGASAQTIPAGVFNINQVFNLIVNNAQNVQLQGTLSLLNSLTVTLGRLDASTATYYQQTMIYSGSAAQSLEANQYMNDEIYNLTIDNGTGVSVNTNFKVDNILTINSGKLLNINPGKLLTVPVSIVNNAGIPGLVVKSDATGDGKLINSTSATDGTVELYLPGGTSAGSARFHYFVPPVQSMSFNNSTPATVATDLGLTYFNGDLASYSELAAGSNKDAGWQYFDGYDYGYGPTTPFSSLVSSTGYNIYLTSNDKVTFKGTLNSTDHAFSNLSFTNIGWNLVGNPYPCNYDLNGIPELTGIGDGVDNTIYFNHDGGFGYWNVLIGGSSGYSDIIPPMQGFFVHVTASGQSLTVPASSKTSASAAPLRSKGTSSVKKIKLVLNNGLVPDETIVCLIDKATTGFDGDFDGYKLFGKSSTNEPYIYTELNGIKYAIDAVPEPTTTPLVIPVTVVLKTTGTYKINITEFENLDGFSVVLKHGAVETTLNKDAFYSFTLAAGTYTDFQLIINSIPTAVEKVPNDKLKTWYNNNFLYINCPADLAADKSKLVIYDIQGKIVYSNNMIHLSPGQTNQLFLSLQKGLYITQLMLNNQRFVSKFVVY